jgi:hypothetical protein
VSTTHGIDTLYIHILSCTALHILITVNRYSNKTMHATPVNVRGDLHTSVQPWNAADHDNTRH